jgi:ribosomal protein S12 methylthiotransferase accessory factor
MVWLLTKEYQMMEINFPGGLAVEATVNGFSVRTDQSIVNGGANSAPSPFDFFLVSIGTCAGFYALRFCKERGISVDGLSLTLEVDRDEDKKKRLNSIRITIHLPVSFPEKYAEAIIRAVDQCSVKRAILDPPNFEVLTSLDRSEERTAEVRR